MVNQSKTSCRITKGEQTLDAVLDLIEIPYSERITFWAGVAQLTEQDYGSLGQFGPGPTLIELELPDRRRGHLYVTHFHEEPGLYYELAGVGAPTHGASPAG